MTTAMSISSEPAAASSTRAMIGTLLVRFLVPLWLLVGALFKFWDLNVNVLPVPVKDAVFWTADWLGTDPSTFFPFALRSMIAVELILVGLMFFVPKLARAAAIAILSLFCIILLVELWGTVQSRAFREEGVAVLLKPCGCFGAWSPPSFVTFLIDFAMLIGCIVCRPGPLGRSVPGWPISGVAAVASLVVGTGLAFGRPDKIIPSPPSGDSGVAAAPAADPPPGPGPAAPTPAPAPAPAPAAGTTSAIVPIPPMPTKLGPTYFVLEKKAVGQQFGTLPIAALLSRPLPEGFPAGRWHLIFYRKDCDHCFEIMNKHFSGELPAPTIAVEIPDAKGKPFPMACKKCSTAVLPKGPDYVLASPLIMTIVDGTIAAICKDPDKPGSIEATLSAWKGDPAAEKAVEGMFLAPRPGPAADASSDGAAAPPAPPAATKPFPPMPAKLEGFYAPDFDKWKGQRLDALDLPLIIERPLPVDLNVGVVTMVFYREDCEHCEMLFADHFAGTLKAPTIAVIIPDSSGQPFDMPCTECKRARLAPGPTYVIETPVVVVSKDGVVQGVIYGRAAEDPAAVEAILPR